MCLGAVVGGPVLLAAAGRAETGDVLVAAALVALAGVAGVAVVETVVVAEAPVGGLVRRCRPRLVMVRGARRAWTAVGYLTVEALGWAARRERVPRHCAA